MVPDSFRIVNDFFLHDVNVEREFKVVIITNLEQKQKPA